MLNRFYLKKPTNHFEDVQTSPWRPIYHAGRHDGCGFTAARLLGGKKKKEDPLLPAPGKCRGRTRLENSPSERIMIVKSGGAGHEAGRGERVAHKRIIKRPA